MGQFDKVHTDPSEWFYILLPIGILVLFLGYSIFAVIRYRKVMTCSWAVIAALIPQTAYLGFGPMTTAYSTVESSLELITLFIALQSAMLVAKGSLAKDGIPQSDVEQGASGSSLECKDAVEQKISEKVAEFTDRMEFLLRTLGKANDGMGAASRTKYQTANFMFLLVIFGIELDMMGFFCKPT